MIYITLGFLGRNTRTVGTMGNTTGDQKWARNVSNFYFKSSSALCLAFIELAGSQRRKLFCFKEDYNGVPDLSDLPPARNFELPILKK